MSQIVNPAAPSTGGAGNANSVSTTIDFGFAGGPGEGDFAQVTVSAPWVTATTKLVPAVFDVSADHDVEDAVAEEITVICTNVVVGVGFDVVGHAPNGSWGRYVVHIIGV